ncbi:MAG: hypothetical protein R3F59_12110 [Myxococcota bacterium]
MWRASLIMAATACAPQWPLPEVPITGGTLAERRLVRRELLAFDEAVGSGRVRLASFEIGDVEGAAIGHLRGRRVTVEPGIVPDDLVAVVRHELCHALDFQEHLTADAPPPLTALEPDLRPMLAAWEDGVPIEETLAHYCQPGPFGAQALSEACPGDDPRGTALTSWLMEHVWVAYDAATREHGPAVGRDLGPEVASSWMEPYQEPVHVVRLLPADDPYGISHSPVPIDLTDGSIAAGGRGRVDRASGYDQRFPGPPVYPVDGRLWAPDDRGVGLEGGPFVSAYRVGFDSYVFNAMDTIAPSAPRLLGWDGEVWWMPKDSCLRPGQGVFVTDDGVFWSTWIEGTARRWAPFVSR